MAEEMPIFVRTFDCLTWLLPATNNFPRAHRHTFTRRLLDAAFDHFAKRELQCTGYVRYVDDIELFAADSTRQLWAWLRAIVDRLARLRLTIHPAAQPRLVTEGVSFLGFHVFPERRRLKRRKGIRFQRQLNRMCEAVASSAMPRSGFRAASSAGSSSAGASDSCCEVAS